MDHYQQELALASHILHRICLCCRSYRKNKSNLLLLVQELVLEQIVAAVAVEVVPAAVVADKQPAVELVAVPAVASASAAYCC